MSITTGSGSERVALVTGGTSGIGAAIAARLRADGLRVAIVGRTAPVGLDDADTGLLILTDDLIAPGAPERVVAAVVERFGRLDVLVNNAGRRHAGSVDTLSLDELRAVFEVNTFAAMAVTAAAVPVMTAQGGGSIVNMVSRLATVGVATLSIYSASKGALLAYTRAAAVELAPVGIRVNAVAPGMTATPLIEDWLQDQADPGAALGSALDGIPLGRLASPADVAGAVSYLASPDAEYLTGVSIPVDGGYTAR